MKISSTPGWVSQLHILIHIVRILFEAIIRSLKQSQGQWVCCTRKSISTSWKLAFPEVQLETFQDRCLDLWTKLSISRHCQLRNIPHESYGSNTGPGPFKNYICISLCQAWFVATAAISEWNGLCQQIEAVRGRRPWFLSPMTCWLTWNFKKPKLTKSTRISEK